MKKIFLFAFAAMLGTNLRAQSALEITGAILQGINKGLQNYNNSNNGVSGNGYGNSYNNNGSTTTPLQGMNVLVVKNYTSSGTYTAEYQYLYAGVWGNSLCLFRNNIASNPVVCGGKRNPYSSLGGYVVNTYNTMAFGSVISGVINYYFFNY